MCSWVFLHLELMAKGRSKCCMCVVFVLFVLGAGLLISGTVVAVLGSFKSLADDEIKKVSTSTTASFMVPKRVYSIQYTRKILSRWYHTRFSD